MVGNSLGVELKSRYLKVSRVEGLLGQAPTALDMRRSLPSGHGLLGFFMLLTRSAGAESVIVQGRIL